MEIKVNREIRNYTESVFFGLALRQCVFAFLACAVAVALYFLLRPHFGIEVLSWACILGAAPFAALGFIEWHGMKAEQILIAWARSEILSRRDLPAAPANIYANAFLNDSNKRGGVLRGKAHKQGEGGREKTGTRA